MRIVLDTTILVRANESSHGLARELLLNIVAGKHLLLLSNEMLYELARVLRYPRLRALQGLSENRILQTAIIGEADVLCTSDEDFYDPATAGFLAKIEIAVLDDIALMKRLRS